MRFRWSLAALAVGVWALGLSAAAEVLTSEPEVATIGAALDSAEESVLAASDTAAARQVELVDFNGSVEVKRGGASDKEKTEEGMLLFPGDTIETGIGATATLGFDEQDKNVVRVEENTISVIILKGDEKLELLKGEVFSAISELPPGSSFEIRTPTAVAGARGTEWVTRYSGEETQVEAYEDMPFVKAIDKTGRMGEEVRVVTGHAARIARFQPPALMGKIPQQRQERWRNMRRDMSQKIQSVRERRGRPERGPLQKSTGGPGGQGKGINSKIRDRRPGGPGGPAGSGKGLDRKTDGRKPAATDSGVRRFERRGLKGQRVENLRLPDRRPKDNRQDSGAVSSQSGNKIKKPGPVVKQAGPAGSRPAPHKGLKPAVVKHRGS